MATRTRAPLAIPEKYRDLAMVFNVLQRDYIALAEEVANIAQATAEAAQTTASTAETTATTAAAAVEDAELRIDFSFELEP